MYLVDFAIEMHNQSKHAFGIISFVCKEKQISDESLTDRRNNPKTSVHLKLILTAENSANERKHVEDSGFCYLY